MNEDPFFGKEIILSEDVVYIGEGEDPKKNIGFQCWQRALEEVYSDKEKSTINHN